MDSSEETRLVANVRAEHEGDGETAPARMAPAVRLTVALDEAAVVAGGELALAATVHNTGDAPARCALDLSGAPAAWCVVDEPSVALGPGERCLLSVTVRPPVTVAPGAAGAGSSPWRLTLRATPDGDAPVPAVAHVALMVGAPAQLSLEFAPAEAEGREATFRATFVNPTAAPAALALLVDDGAEGATGLRVRVEPGGTVLVGPGERATVTARVAPPRAAPSGPRTYDLTLRGQDVGALDDTSPYLTRRARFSYVPHGGVGGGSGARPLEGETVPASRPPRRVLLLIPLLLLPLLVLGIARVVTSRPATRPESTVVAAALPAIERFAAGTDLRTRAPILRWRVVGATATTLDGVAVAPVSSKALAAIPGGGGALVAAQTHLLRATNRQGTVIGIVTAPAAAATPVSLAPPTIQGFTLRHDRGGGRYRLVWGVRDARTVTLDGRAVLAQGHYVAPVPIRGHTYRLVANSDVGRVEARVVVVVSTVAATPSTRTYVVTPRP